MDPNDDGMASKCSEPNKAVNSERKVASVVAGASSSAANRNNNENQQKTRVIKQIFTLDAKKLKSLGIESNILSAITKLNGKKGIVAASTAPKKQEKVATPLPASPQAPDTTKRSSSESAKVPLVKVPVTVNDTKCTISSSVADKKVHVLSDVVLNELDLDHLSATLTSKSIKNAKDVLIGAHPSTSRIELPLRTIDLTQCNDEIPADATHSTTFVANDEQSEFAGFYPSMEEIARNQLEELNALALRMSSKQTTSVKCNQVPVANIADDGTSSSSSESSDAESDLSIGELIYTAKLAIENDDKSKSMAEQTKRASVDSELSDHIDKDKLIDDFLSSMKSSFRVHHPIQEDNEDSQQIEGVERSAMSSSSSSSSDVESDDGMRMESINNSSATIDDIGSDVDLTVGSPAIEEPQIEIEIDLQETEEPTEMVASPRPNVTSPSESKSPKKLTEIIPETKTIDLSTTYESVAEAASPDEPLSPSPKSVDIVPPKRRGRKPKQKQLVDDSMTIEIEEVTATPVDVEPGPNEASISLSRSGRRRKQRIIDDFFYSPKTKQATTEPSHGAIEGQNNEIKIESDTQPDAPIHVEPTTPAPGRRGRKRKIQEPEAIEAELVETTPEPDLNVSRRRGRPKKNSNIPAEIVTSTPIAASRSLRQTKLNASAELELSNETTKDVALPVQRKRGRRKVIESEDEKPAAVEKECAAEEEETVEQKETVEQTETVENVVPAKRGRKPKLAPVFVTNKSFTCGNCQEVIPVQRWKRHETSHYGLAWRDGIDNAIDVNDEALVLRLMSQFVKRNKVNYLTCSKCGEKKKSSVGYMSHMQVCGLTEEELANARVKCEHCGKSYRKVSLPIHLQGFCPVLRIKKQQEEAALRAAAGPEQVNEPEENVERESRRRTSRYGRKKKKRIFYDSTVNTTPLRMDGYVKKNRITGGTFIGWKRMLRESNIIQCPTEDCPFACASTEEMHLHYKTCAPRFRCAFCKHFGVERDTVVEHIRTAHVDEMRVLNGPTKNRESDDEDGGGDGEDDDDDDFNASGDESSSSGGYSTSGDESSEMSGDDEPDSEGDDRTLRIKPKRSKKITSLKYHMETFAPKLWLLLRSHYQEILYLGDEYYPHAMSWTRQFVADNYNSNGLAIGDGGGSVRVLRDSRKYLLPMHSQSVPFQNATRATYELNNTQPSEAEGETAKEDLWQQLPLFGSACDADDSKSGVIFCGGPTIAMEWVPFPAEYTGPQVLVVCARRPNGQHTALRGKQEKSEYLIQLWRVTMRTKTEVDRCEFMYGVACDDGPILCMHLCPSDAFVDGSQLALLAVPSYNGSINILALPFDVPGAKRPRMVAIKPKIVLELGEAHETVSQLAWSREHGHTTICAGYTNGMVAVWNLRNLNSMYMCRRHDDGSRSLRPQRVFQPKQKCITILAIHADHTSTPRWLLVGGLDRTVCFYDLNDPFASKMSMTSFKSRLIAGTWPMYWPHYICLYDSAMGFSGASASIKFVHEIFNFPTRSLGFEGTPSNVAFNDWLNCCIYGNDSGDLFFIRFQQLLLHDRLDSSSDVKIIGMTDAVEYDSQQCIVFNDIVPSVDVTKYQQLRQPTIDQMPATKVNRIAFNANESNHKVYAIGYESGFCRITSLP